MASVYEQLLALDWPREFMVEYVAGDRERLLRGDSVQITRPDDDPEDVGGIVRAIAAQASPQSAPRSLRPVQRTADHPNA